MTVPFAKQAIKFACKAKQIQNLSTAVVEILAAVDKLSIIDDLEMLEIIIKVGIS